MSSISSDRRVLITGASGFVGSYVTKALLAAGFKVSATCRQKKINLWRLEGIKDRIEWINVDTLDSIGRIFESTRFSAVIHLATDYGRTGDYNEPDLVYSNILFPLTLIAAANQKGIKLFINTDTFLNSKDLKYGYLKGYTLSKKHFLDWLSIFSETYGIRVVNMKLFHAYGPLDSGNKFVPSIIRLCLEGGVIPMTSGKQARDFIYVDDVASAFMAVLAKELESNSDGLVSLDIGTGSMCSIREFVNTANRLMGGKASIDYGALPDRPGEPYFAISNIEGIAQYGWHSMITIEAGLKSVIDWLRKKEG